ncbi:MAG TPA: hypothetical protein EYQ14_12590 [Gammaproteobacteria bacterium]|nr:hypothetical protein [Gammaproteobacteria bacterium]
MQDGSDRYFNGFCSEFAQTGRLGGYATYQAVLRPWLWFLTSDGQVLVNGEVETRKRKKIVSGDMVEFMDQKLRILLKSKLAATSFSSVCCQGFQWRFPSA